MKDFITIIIHTLGPISIVLFIIFLILKWYGKKEKISEK
jgi:hypothetical protein